MNEQFKVHGMFIEYILENLNFNERIKVCAGRRRVAILVRFPQRSGDCYHRREWFGQNRSVQVDFAVHRIRRRSIGRPGARPPAAATLQSGAGSIRQRQDHSQRQFVTLRKLNNRYWLLLIYRSHTGISFILKQQQKINRASI